MDLFEKHFAMLAKNQEIFEQYKMTNSVRVNVSDKRQEDYLKSGKELLTTEKSKQFMEVRSIHYRNVVMKKMEEYTLPEWLVCLNEEVLLEYAIPVFFNVLQKYPMLCGLNNEWQVLYDITKISRQFWCEHNEWKLSFRDFINEILLKYEEGGFEVSIPEEYLYQFMHFNES